MREIVDLENKPITRLYSKVEEKVDNITGEVSTIVSSFLQKEKTKDDFIKLFVENINYLTDNLSNSALRVVLMMFRNLNYQNIFHYNSDFVSYFTNKKILGKSSVYRAIKELEEKNVIFKITKEQQQEEYDIISPNSYIINPQIIGKNSFKDLKKLRQTTVKEFDFEKLEMIQKVEVESEYEGLEEVKENPDDYYVEDIKQISYPNTIENQIIISKREAEADNQTLIANDTQPSLFDNKENNKEMCDFWNMCGALTGAYHPTKSAKELKREKLDQDLKEGRI